MLPDSRNLAEYSKIPCTLCARDAAFLAPETLSTPEAALSASKPNWPAAPSAACTLAKYAT